MKKLAFSFLFIITLLFVIGFKSSVYEAKNNTAEVVQIEGLYIFTDCKPVKEYVYLGTVRSSTGGFGNSQYEGVRNRLIKKIKKDFPDADGTIIYCNYGQADKADAIKFK